MSGSEDSMSRILALVKSFRYPSVYFEICRGAAPIQGQRMTRETLFAGQFTSLSADGSCIEIVLVNLRKPSMRPSAWWVDRLRSSVCAFSQIVHVLVSGRLGVVHIIGCGV